MTPEASPTSEFISEDDLEVFEKWLKYQGAPRETLAPEELEEWGRAFDEVRKSAGATPKVGLMKIRRAPGEHAYAVAVRDDGLWLALWVKRNKRGEVFILVPRGDRTWDAHTSYHRDGTVHSKSHGKKFMERKRQPLTDAFRGTEPIEVTGGYGPKKVGAVCNPNDFTGVIEIPPRILGPRHGGISTDLVEPGCNPVSHGETWKIVERMIFKEVSPWLVISVMSSSS